MTTASSTSVWLIGGPTAGGKSALALALAERIGGEILNADSVQLYADLRVLSARPSEADEARVPHHLFGVADAAEAWSVGRWLRAALPMLSEIGAHGRPAILVGGTGLYFAALTRGLADAPSVPAGVRSGVEALWTQNGEAAVRLRLRLGDPASEARIAPGDRQRLVRALSVLEATGTALSRWRSETRSALPPGSWRGVVLEPPRAALYAACDARARQMAEEGALQEAEALLARGLPPELPAMKALGVREFAEALRGEASIDAAVAATAQATRRYAKRQMTWFRNQTPGWLRLERPDVDALLAA